MGLSAILTVIAIICFAAAALGVGASRVQLGWAGLAFWALASLV